MLRPEGKKRDILAKNWKMSVSGREIRRPGGANTVNREQGTQRDWRNQWEFDNAKMAVNGNALHLV